MKKYNRYDENMYYPYKDNTSIKLELAFAKSQIKESHRLGDTTAERADLKKYWTEYYTFLLKFIKLSDFDRRVFVNKCREFDKESGMYQAAEWVLK